MNREARLVKLEAGIGAEQAGPAWWAVQKWLGNRLTPEQEAAVAEWEVKQPPYDPAAPMDFTGWSQNAIDWWQGRC